MFLAAHAIGSHAGFFRRSGSDVYQVEKSAWKVCAGFGFTGKILPVCFPASCVRAFDFPRVARPAFRSRKKQGKGSSKTPKTEHKNVGLYAQKTPQSAY